MIENQPHFYHPLTYLTIMLLQFKSLKEKSAHHIKWNLVGTHPKSIGTWLNQKRRATRNASFCVLQLWLVTTFSCQRNEWRSTGMTLRGSSEELKPLIILRQRAFSSGNNVLFKWGQQNEKPCTQEEGRNTRRSRVFLPTILSCSEPLPACFTTEQSTVKASLFFNSGSLGFCYKTQINNYD